MAVFVLKKYAVPEEGEKEEESVAAGPTDEEKKEEESFSIHVTGSISEIIAKALQKTLANKEVEVSELEEEHVDEADVAAKAISTEDIRDEPVKTLRSISDNDVVFISSEGFNTKTDEWFLLNLNNKTKNVFYTVNSFMNYVSDRVDKMCLSSK